MNQVVSVKMQFGKTALREQPKNTKLTRNDVIRIGF